VHLTDRRQLLLGMAATLPASTALAAPASTLSAGGIASPDKPGAEAGAEILKAGGNAIDAAVAMGFALAVSYPEAGNIGGGGFMTVLFRGKPYFLDYRETAPGLAKAQMYLGPDGEVIQNRSVVDNQSAGVPGTVCGLAEAHKRFGVLSWKQVLEPAIRLAREGFIPPAQMIGILKEAEGYLLEGTNLADHFGHVVANVPFRQPELAQTLMRIAERGPDGFYRGETAQMIVAQMQRGPNKGLISLDDLATYRCAWRQPVTGRWNGYEVITAPPPSSGGIALMQLLGMKAARADLFAGVELNSPQYVHLLSEIEKRVFADRAQYLGDPDFVRVPVHKLIDPAYIKRRARELSASTPSTFQSVVPGLESHQTTHYSVIDRQGNAVSNTYTLNGWYGSGVVVEGAGFLLNNEMDDFSSKPGVPNMYGVVGGDANAIAARKRPLSSMTPTILARKGQPVLALGSPGGSRIITSVFQVIVNACDYNLPLKAAVDAPRYHHQLLPENTIFTEPYAAADPRVKSELEARGYKFEAQDWNGDIEAVQIVNATPVVSPDPRARGYGLIVR
jgi:gamma-glutamyltranspeptidase/glutathione hydrolase